MNKKYNLYLWFLFACLISYGQKKDISTIIDSSSVLYKNRMFKESILYIESKIKSNDFKINDINKLYIELYKNSYWIDKNSCINYLYKSKINYTKYNNETRAQLNYFLGNIHRIMNKHNDSIVYYSLNSLKFYEQSSNKKLKSKLYRNLSIAYNNSGNNKLHYKYLKKNLYEVIKLNDKNKLALVYNNIGTYFSSTKHIDSSTYYYKKALKLEPTSKIKGSVYQNIGGLYLGQKKIDSAEFYLDIALKNKMSDKAFASLYFNKAVINKKRCKNKLAIASYLKSYDYAVKYNGIEMQSFISEDLSNLYETMSDFNKSLYYRKKYQKLNDSIRRLSITKNINELETKYQTEKKEKENIQLQVNIEKEQSQKKNLLYGSLVLLLFGGITTALSLKNSKRKRLLAEKNNEIEQQKVITLLKEQELTSIDAMIEGQEKERKRIAEDLHDDLGSVLTTLKLHFENYKVNKTKKKFSEDELIDKTDALLDEAYKKVRNIAHAKNSGVIANQGLLLAIENMAEKVSSSKKIEIEVVNHGLENRLENSLELTIFRIIQELITNIIKHAEATQATIHLINHEKSLNIMVEDNGKGFDTSQISNKGMGIHSIDKRVEHLDGTMTIESEINKGTTIIIDIPI